MAEVPDITLYTASAGAFLYDVEMLVMEPEVSQVVAYIGRNVVPNRMSYAR
jgi:hypothetical protein